MTQCLTGKLCFSQKKVFNGCHTDVFLKTACAQSCLIELIEGLGNEGKKSVERGIFCIYLEIRY